MNAEEIILTIYDKCKEAHDEMMDAIKVLGVKDKATDRLRAIWCVLDDLYQEITGKEIDY